MAVDRTGWLKAAFASDIGRVRQRNEDAAAVDMAQGLLIVSDGIGGAAGGDLASQFIVHELPRVLTKRLEGIAKPTNQAIREALAESVSELSRTLYNQTAAQPALEGMGATVVTALVRGRWAHLAHAGDSRAYLLRRGELRQLTEDHSVIAALVRGGHITAEEAMYHPARGMISRCVGMDDVIAETRSVALRPGDKLLLCSDGLFGMLPDERIKEILAAAGEPREAVAALVEAANGEGGLDNVTALVADWGPEAIPPPQIEESPANGA